MAYLVAFILAANGAQPVTDEMLRHPDPGRLADDPRQLSGLEITAR
jgi:hypothetical protein